MVNEKRQRGVPNWQRQAWLTEYQACQHYNTSSSSQYYSIVGIFMTVITALSGGLAYILAITSTSPYTNAHWVILALGLGIIAILVLLWFWLKRVNYLADRNYERMREIELDLEMWQSWRIHSLDKWRELGLARSDPLGDERINQIWEKLKQKLKERLPNEEYVKKLEMRKKELVQFCNLYPDQRWYERPSRNFVYKLILCTLIVLWAFFIIMGFIN